jgi:hypothetical protein
VRARLPSGSTQIPGENATDRVARAPLAALYASQPAIAGVLTDDELMKRTVGGDRQAFETLVRRHQD